MVQTRASFKKQAALCQEARIIRAKGLPREFKVTFAPDGELEEVRKYYLSCDEKREKQECIARIAKRIHEEEEENEHAESLLCEAMSKLYLSCDEKQEKQECVSEEHGRLLVDKPKAEAQPVPEPSRLNMEQHVQWLHSCTAALYDWFAIGLTAVLAGFVLGLGLCVPALVKVLIALNRNMLCTAALFVWLANRLPVVLAWFPQGLWHCITALVKVLTAFNNLMLRHKYSLPTAAQTMSDWCALVYLDIMLVLVIIALVAAAMGVKL